MCNFDGGDQFTRIDAAAVIDLVSEGDDGRLGEGHPVVGTARRSVRDVVSQGQHFMAVPVALQDRELVGAQQYLAVAAVGAAEEAPLERLGAAAQLVEVRRQWSFAGGLQ